MKIIIAGGGIGGLVTAISLRKAGFDPFVFESVEEVRPLGVGINLLPHAVRVLTNLGLQEELGKIAVETKELVYANRFGQFFWEEPRGKFAGYKWSQYSIHRGEFQYLLWRIAEQILGKDRIFSGYHAVGFEQDESSVRVRFLDRKNEDREVEVSGDILVGADGIHSQIRKLLYPAEGGVVFSGQVLYRGTSKIKPYLSEASMAMIGSMKQKMVVYPIGPKLDEDGNQLINWVANLRESDGAQLTVRDWNRQVGKEKLLELYSDWTFDWLDVKELIATSESIYEFPMSDRDPLDRWSFGRVTLLGDAAHPMYPIGSNGASQAILDAEALTDALLMDQHVISALGQYDQVRVPATAQVVRQNREKGPDFIMDLMEDRFPNGFSPSEIPQQELADIMEGYKRIAGFDRESLNKKS